MTIAADKAIVCVIHNFSNNSDTSRNKDRNCNNTNVTSSHNHSAATSATLLLVVATMPVWGQKFINRTYFGLFGALGMDS